MHGLSGRHPRYGYRRIAALLRRDGWRVNDKRVARLWRQEGLKVPQRRHKRRRLGHSANGCQRRRAEHRNHVWAYDFKQDRTEDGRRLKFLVITDEYTRECLHFHPERHIRAEDIVEIVGRLVRERGAPRFLRSDNGPEFIAHALRRRLRQLGVGTLFIAPGSPWENAYVESFNSKAGDELLDLELFTSLAEAQYLAREYRDEYNHRRPHSSLGYRTPAEFAYEGGTPSSDGGECEPKAAFAASAKDASLRACCYTPSGQQTLRSLVS